MKPLVEQVLLGEIVTQSKFAARAAVRIAESSDPIDVWGSIQSLMVAAGNVSKILWPARKQNKKRGKHIRELLGVADNNLVANRTLRNHFEHYDERVEEWFEGNDSIAYADSKIGPTNEGPLGLTRLYHRSYDPVTRILSFRDQSSIDLGALLSDLEEIREKCQHLTLA